MNVINNDKLRIDAPLGRVAGFLEYLLGLVIVVECNSMFTFATQTVGRVDMAKLLGWAAAPLLAVLVLIHAFRQHRALGEIAPNLALLALLMGAAALFYVGNVRFQEPANRKDFLLKFALCLPLLVALFKLKQREGKGLELLLKYSDIVCVIAALSLLVYLASEIGLSAVPADAIYTPWNDRNVTMAQANLLEVCQFIPGSAWQMFGIELLKNRGPFTEPLMFALPLLMALYTELFLRDAGDRWRGFRWALLTATLVTVNATIALMLLAAAWGLKGVQVFLRGNARGRRWIVALVVIAAAAVCAVFVLEKGRMSYDETSATPSSMAMHVEDYVVCLRAFAQKPIFGGGYQNNGYIYDFLRPWRQANNPSFSNSAGVVLAHGGVVLGVLCTLPLLLGLLYLLSDRDRRVALWTLGPLGAYVGIIFKYQLLLIFLMAFGYSLIDVRRARGGGFPLRLALVDTRARQEPAARRGARPWAAMFAILAVNALLIAFGTPVFQAIHAFLRGHQFSMGQSPLRAFCLAAALLLNGVCLRRLIRRELSWTRMALLAAWDGIYLLIYPPLFSAVGTLLGLFGAWGELRECAALLLVYLLPAAAILLAQPGSWTRGGWIVRVAALAACVALACVGGLWKLDRSAALAEPLVPEVQAVAECASGRVYVNDLPMLYHRQVKGVALPATKDSGFDACGCASVVFPEGGENPELLEAGFSLAKLADGALLYTNDPAVLSALGERGTTFYRYYPFGTEVDLAQLAEANGLSMPRDGGLVVDGPLNSLEKGPYVTLRGGQYRVEYALKAEPKALAGLAKDAPVASVEVVCDRVRQRLAQETVCAGDFDDKGFATVSVPFSLPDITDGLEYRLLGQADLPVEARSITLYNAPDYISSRTYNGHRDCVEEAFFTLDGKPCALADGASIIERDFDRVDRVTAVRVYDADHAPILTPGGYHEYRYAYNAKGSLMGVAYYGPDGESVEVDGGYARFDYTYDAYGALSSVDFYDARGEWLRSEDLSPAAN